MLPCATTVVSDAVPAPLPLWCSPVPLLLSLMLPLLPSDAVLAPLLLLPLWCCPAPLLPMPLPPCPTAAGDPVPHPFVSAPTTMKHCLCSNVPVRALYKRQILSLAINKVWKFVCSIECNAIYCVVIKVIFHEKILSKKKIFLIWMTDFFPDKNKISLQMIFSKSAYYICKQTH